jgi:2-hydroxycyclohexanecarboxyl-CoA dehydrogenase
MTFDHHGRRALITGAGQGVGRSIGLALAESGAHIFVNDLDAGRAKAVADEITAAGGSAEPAVADITDAAAIVRLREATGPVDILVNNAGVPPGFVVLTPFLSTTPESWRPWFALNVDAVMRLTHTYVPAMAEAGLGRVLTIVSDAGRVGESGQVAYGAAKAAAMGFSRGVAVEVGRAGVTVNCIALGAIRHGVVADFLDANPDQEKQLVRRYPLRRMGLADDPAPLAVLLCSDAGGWITGQVYPVNGGYSHAL